MNKIFYRELAQKLNNGMSESMVIGISKEIFKINKPFTVKFRDTIINKKNFYDTCFEIDPNGKLELKISMSRRKQLEG